MALHCVLMSWQHAAGGGNLIAIADMDGPYGGSTRVAAIWQW